MHDRRTWRIRIAMRRVLGGCLVASLLFPLAWTVRADTEAEPPSPTPSLKTLYGVVINATTQTPLLVVSNGQIHRLEPGHRSPPGVDADALRAADGSPIRGYTGWWKIPDGITATVLDEEEGVTVQAFVIWRVTEDAFGQNLRMVEADWGVPIPDAAEPPSGE